MQIVDSTSLQSEILHVLITWYEARCGSDGSWPLREEFRPETLPPAVLPHVARIDVETDPFRVFYRAAGSIFSESFGIEMSGRYLDETGLPQTADVTEWFRRFIDAPGVVCIRGDQAVRGQSFVCEACCLPFGPVSGDPRAFVLGEDFLNTESWRSALRGRSYRPPS